MPLEWNSCSQLYLKMMTINRHPNIKCSTLCYKPCPVLHTKWKLFKVFALQLSMFCLEKKNNRFVWSLLWLDISLYTVGLYDSQHKEISLWGSSLRGCEPLQASRFDSVMIQLQNNPQFILSTLLVSVVDTNNSEVVPNSTKMQ